MQTRIESDVHIAGALSASSFVPPDGCIDDDAMAASGGGTGIATSKLKHRHHRNYGKAGTAASESFPIHIARAAGTVVSIEAGSIAIAIGGATVVIDLKKNGSSILTSTFTLDSGNTARVLEAGVINTAAYVDGDFFELVITATASGGTIPTGLCINVVFDEQPS